MRQILLYIAAIAALGVVCAHADRSGSVQLSVPQSADTVVAPRVRPDTADSIRRMPESAPMPVEPADTTDSLSTARSIMANRERLTPDTSSRTRLGRIDRRKVDIENAVDFKATDSLVLVGQNQAYMYGDGTVTYGEMNLNAGEIRMDLDSATVYAVGVTDSAGNVDGYPVFSDKSGEYESKSMKYNFKTERGYITDVVTSQGEGYLVGGRTKKMEDGTYFVQDGRYTTCDDHEHPHFYFQITKGKVIPKKNIVTGPAYMVLADVPLPIALPFGYFPFSKDYSSGIIFPSFGEDYNRGFYLRDGGYYFAINDYVDLAIRGEIYTKGSWGLNGRSSYVKRYRYRGSFDFSYLTTITGDKGSPDYSKGTNFRIMWSHSQDTKANPNMTFSASVNFTTSGYTRSDLNSYYSSAFTENTKSSTVNMTYRFPGSKWSLSTTANIAQRTQDSTLAVSFPNLTVTMSQTAPFKRKKAVGGERWYEKIKMSYSGQFQNSLTAQQNVFFKKSLIKDWRNGMKHNIPISATFSLFKYINISPSININDRMYTTKIRRQWDTQASREVTDTTYGFYNIFDFSASISLDTKLYGFYKPMKFLGDKVQMIRHVLTPTVSFYASPDFGAPGWGIFGQYNYVDAQGVTQQRRYSYFQHGLYGAPSAGKSGVVSVNLSNNVEMKVKSDADSTGVKKISLIENLSISQSYNFAADSLNWSNINTSILLRLVKNFNLSLNATWDPYLYGLSASGSPVHINKLRMAHGKLPKLSSTGTSFSYTFNNSTFKRKQNNENEDRGREEGENWSGVENENVDEWADDEDFAAAAKRRREKRRGQDNTESDADGYEKWEVPWSLTVNYSVNYGYGAFDYDRMDYKGKWTQNLSFSGNIRPAKGWNFSLSSSYNFDAHKIAYMNCSVSRDIHCFTMTASFVPVGPYKSYNFHIAVKSSLLQDLKWDKRSSTTNGIRWY